MKEETVTIEYKGQTYVGSRTITGTRTRFQTIYYAGRSKADGRRYRSEEDAYMKNIARIILRELVEEELRESTDSA